MSTATRSRIRGALDRLRARFGAASGELPTVRTHGAPRVRSIRELRPEVAALALAGVSTLEIARRTGLAHDAIGLILHLGIHSEGENSAGRGTMFRVEPRTWAGAAQA